MEGVICVKNYVLLMSNIGLILYDTIYRYCLQVHRYQNHRANLLNIQTEVSDLFVNTHKAVPVVLSLSIPAWALCKEGESLLTSLKGGLVQRLCHGIFQIGCVCWHKRSSDQRNKGFLHLCSLGMFLQDLAIIKIRTEVVCTATFPLVLVAVWCLSRKEHILLDCPKKHPLQVPKLNVIGKKDWGNCCKTALLR